MKLCWVSVIRSAFHRQGISTGRGPLPVFVPIHDRDRPSARRVFACIALLEREARARGYQLSFGFLLVRVAPRDSASPADVCSNDRPTDTVRKPPVLFVCTKSERGLTHAGRALIGWRCLRPSKRRKSAPASHAASECRCHASVRAASGRSRRFRRRRGSTLHAFPRRKDVLGRSRAPSTREPRAF